MNLLDTASLVVTPNGYKASKLYSIIPSDGSGDMTFARTGDTATRVNPNGLIEVDAANIPRLDYLGGGCPKLLLEPQRTNTSTYSQQFDDASWIKGSAAVTVTANTQISPDGTQNADTITCNGTGDQFVRKNVYSGVTNQSVVGTVFAKKGNTRYFALKTKVNGNYNVFDFDTKTWTNNDSSTLSYQELANGWFRLISVSTDSNVTYWFRFFPCANTVGLENTTSSNLTAYVWGAHSEVNVPYATSYIPTTTASVTRNGDYANTSLATTNANWTISCDFDFIPDEDIFNIFIGTSTSRFVSLYSSFSNLRCVYNAGAGAVAGLNLTNTAKRTKVVFQNDGTNCIAFLNGVKMGSVGNASAVALTGTSTITFTFYGGGSVVQSKSRVRSVTRHNTTLTDQECITLSTI